MPQPEPKSADRVPEAQPAADPPNSVQFPTEPSDTGQRIDHWLHARMPDFSRSRIQEWIKSGRVRVNGAAVKTAHTMRAGDTVEVEPADPPPLNATAEDIPLHDSCTKTRIWWRSISQRGWWSTRARGCIRELWSTRYFIASGSYRAWAARCGRGSSTGWTALPAASCWWRRTMLRTRLWRRSSPGGEVEKVYLTLVHGVVKSETGRIERPIARDPVHRARMTARLAEGRAAWSEYRVLRRFADFTLLEVRIGTGRTHQIRVHLASIKHPVVGDTLYGAPAQPLLGRYFLHAHRIKFHLPSTGAEIEVKSPLAAELETWLSATL